MHRLNRAEYANAVRDLLGVEIDVAELLPSDGGDFGFDNIASVLTTSPLLLERYLTAALRIADAAIGDVQAAPTAATYKIGVEVTQNQHMAGLPIGTRGGTVVRHNFPADAEYVLSGRLLNTVAEGYSGVEGHDEPHEFVITIDGEQVFSARIGGPEDHAENSRDFLGVARRHRRAHDVAAVGRHGRPARSRLHLGRASGRRAERLATASARHAGSAQPVRATAARVREHRGAVRRNGR